ncbi:MAG: hypothetical protein WCJ53_09330 [Mycobacteriaceae bacterium]
MTLHRSRVVSAVLSAHLVAWVVAPAVWADPAVPPAPTDVAAPADVAAAPDAMPELVASQDPGTAVSDACRQFGAALNLAATKYEDFAYAIAGNGNNVNYQDPLVIQANSIGRAALRAAAGTAMDAAKTPGLPPQVSDPMQSWSVRATKLLVIMGLHGGGDSLNATATDLNTDAQNVQMACALNGGHA